MAEKQAGEIAAPNVSENIGAALLAGMLRTSSWPDISADSIGLKAAIPSGLKNLGYEFGVWRHTNRNDHRMTVFDPVYPYSVTKHDIGKGFTCFAGTDYKIPLCGWFEFYARGSLDYTEFDFKNYNRMYHIRLESLGIEGGAGMRFIVSGFTIDLGIDYTDHFKDFRLRNGTYYSIFGGDSIEDIRLGPTRVYAGIGYRF
ncbi:MAG: hypothetical protein ACYS8W_06835 [Planctomycetota bacterium]